jgi:catechol 2,3-dioxygenase-like lactoylglutathione lyase family enzyme
MPEAVIVAAARRLRDYRNMQLHPIMYVADQYAERAFYELFGFERTYEGEEFPGFLAIRHGEAVIGLQRASPEQPGYRQGIRWQFELETAHQVDDVIVTCREHGLAHEVATERGGDRFLTRLVSVTSPSGITVWFEGPNEADSAEA